MAARGPTKPASEPPPERHGMLGWLIRPMRYQNAYVWLVLVSAMDIMLTWRILERGGTEMNPIARWVIDKWQLNGAIVFKFGLMIFVIVVCEVVGRRRNELGRGLAYLAVIVSALPVVYSLGLLVVHTFMGDQTVPTP